MPIRITGPYRQRDKLRFRLTLGPGSYAWAPVGDTEDEARRLAEEVVATVQGRLITTVSGLVEGYLSWLAVMDRKPSTIRGARVHLMLVVAPLMHLEIASVNATRARARYRELADMTAAATHHVALGRARSAWKWAIRQGMARHNPWLEVDRLGRAKRGKPQLRIDEARQLRDTCLSVMDDGALAVLMALLMGLRASEIVSRTVRDLDNGGRVLVIPDAKTEAGKRPAEIPEEMQETFRMRTVNRKPMDFLLRSSTRESASRWWVEDQVRRYCLLADVPVVCPHGLRGSLATILYEGGAAPRVVAAVLGHASSEVTERHYAKPDAVGRAEQRRRMSVIDGGKK